MIELLVVVAIIGILAAMLFPALSRTKRQAQRASCLSNLKQQGIAWRLYLDDHSGRFPDRRALKSNLPGGYLPWSTWPKSDPRAGWAALVLKEEISSADVWACPPVQTATWDNIPQSTQAAGTNTSAFAVRYWMWRFDRADDPIPDDNFWGRTEAECVSSLRAAKNPITGFPGGPSDVELTVDVYFPNTIPAVPAELKGRTAHPGGRNRLMLDGHTDFIRDARTPSG